MDKYRFIATFFIFIIIFSNTVNASLVFNLRRLITAAPNDNSTNLQVPPVGSPVDVNNELNPGLVNGGKSEKEKDKESEVSNEKDDSLTVDSKGTNKNDADVKKDTSITENSKDSKKNEDDVKKNSLTTVDSEASKKNEDDANSKNDKASKKNGDGANNKNVEGAKNSPPDMEKGDKEDEVKEKADNATKTQLGDNEICKGALRSCRNKGMLACIEAPKNGAKELFLLVQNEGENNLKVSVNFSNSMKSGLPAFDVPKHQTRRIDISSTTGKNTKIALTSGNGNCELDLDRSVSVDSYLQQLSFYSRQVTPIHVAYFLFLLSVLSGGLWGCCKLRKKSRHDGIPYQELEMGLPESATAVNVETAEGWDQDWDDDDWDEDNAVKSPIGHHIRNVSANGLTSRSSKKDEWDDDWED